MPYSCSVCKKRLASKRTLQSHVVLIHKNAGKFACKFCGKTFSSSNAREVHHRIHTGEKPFACQLCQSHFASKNGLSRHLIDVHGPKIFKCKSCHMEFSRERALNRHRFTHTGEKPFQCEYCTHKFRRSDHLKTHCLRFHAVCPQTHSNNHLEKHPTHHSVSQRDASEQRRLARDNNPEEFDVNSKRPRGSTRVEGRRLRKAISSDRVNLDDVKSGEANESGESGSSGNFENCNDFRQNDGEPSDLDEQSSEEDEPNDRPPHWNASANLKVVFDVEYRAPESP